MFSCHLINVGFVKRMCVCVYVCVCMYVRMYAYMYVCFTQDGQCMYKRNIEGL